MLDKVIGAVHLAVYFFLGLYAFLFRKSSVDYLVLLWEYTSCFTWTFFEGKCPISHYVRKWFKAEAINDSSVESNDMITLFGEKHVGLMKAVLYANFVLLVITLILVLRRNKMNVLLWITPIPVYYLLLYLKNKVINLVFRFIFFVYIIAILRRFIGSFFQKKQNIKR